MKSLVFLLSVLSTTAAFHAAASPFLAHHCRSSGSPSSSSTSRLATYVDSDEILPEFASEEEYLAYMTKVSALPKGFATGTASGKFVPVEAPLLGELPIRGTVIHLTQGPTTNWAAVFTSNKVSEQRIK
jgi:hypothetical protein